MRNVLLSLFALCHRKKTHKTLQENILGGWRGAEKWVSADVSLLQPKDKDDPVAGATKRGAVPTSGPYLTSAIQNFSYKDDHSLTLNLYPIFS